jgi:hypothetical protein
LAVVLGMLCGPTASAAPAHPGTGPSTSTSPSSVYAKAMNGPGCDRAPVHPDGTHPATPPRGSSTYDLLPVLFDGDRSAQANRHLDAALSTAPRRGPPTPVPPSPVELSVLLRV